MKLAEALADRAAAKRRLAQLRSRITASARYQEGDDPSEDANALLDEAGAVLDELEVLIRRINRTNSNTQIASGATMTDALARRDVLRERHALMTASADAASGTQRAGLPRQLRSELRMITAMPVAALRSQADDLARQLRDLDVDIQRANWEVDLLE